MKCATLIFLTFFVGNVLLCTNSKWHPFQREGPHIAALILARGGSKGIPLKNLAKIRNRSLLNNTLSIILSTKTPKFHSVWVSTDNSRITRECGPDVNVHWRSPESATDKAPSISGVQDFIESHPEVDIVALVQCTSPFLRRKYLEQALKLIVDPDIDCVFSVTRSFKLRWLEKWNGTLSPGNFDPKKRPRRQDWNGELVENGMFYFAKRQLIENNLLQNERCDKIEVPEEDSLEINTKFDLILAERISETLGP